MSGPPCTVTAGSAVDEVGPNAVILVAAALSLTPACVLAWGLATHRAIEEHAIETLPPPLRSYFRSHRSEISDGSVEPDTVLRDRDGQKEAVKHFIDLDLYGAPPFPGLPRSYDAAVERFGKEVVAERGTLLWTIEEKHARLVREMRGADWRAAVRTAAHAGHYIADATMPLHAISDYDGRKSGSPGIHKAVERGLVDARLGEYMARVQPSLAQASAAAYSQKRVFDVLVESYRAAPELLTADRRARHRGELGTAVYLDALDHSAGNLLTARLSRAIELLGAFWLSAWEEAGRPPPSQNQ
jgi:hypothetical protein